MPGARAGNRCAQRTSPHILPIMITFLTILVALGMLGTLGTLLFGMVGMVRGSEDAQRSNALMRWRVTLQAVTLLLFALLLYMTRG
jgi:hypothetical protein